MKLLHNYVLIQLIPFQGETITESGIIIPKTTPQETDGGRVVSVIDENARYQPKGEVLAFSDKAKAEIPQLTEGVIVRVGRGAMNVNQQYYPDTTTPVQEWEGMILIPSGLIESVYDQE